MKEAVFKWFKMVLVALVLLLVPWNRLWPVDKEPAPTLSLASAWFCEKFANGVGIAVLNQYSISNTEYPISKVG